MHAIRLTPLAQLVLALLLACATPVNAETSGAGAASDSGSGEHVTPAERSQDKAQALQEQLPASEQRLLKAGDDSFLALWKPANTPTPQGIVILLPDDGESADWPQSIGPLRKRLPDAGWHTLSLTLPDPYAQAPVASVDVTAATDNTPAETAEPETAPSAASAPASAATEASDAHSASVEQHSKRVLARIQAGLAFAQQQSPGKIILLGHGTGGYWGMEFLAQNNNSKIQGLLLLSATAPAGLSPDIEERLPKLQLAIGDFFFNDPPSAAAQAQLRKQAALRSKHPAYRQVALSALPGNPQVEQEQLYRRVRGWLEKNATPVQSPAEMKKQPAQGQRKP